MQRLQAFRHSPQDSPTLCNDPPSSMCVPFADDGLAQFERRWEPQILLARNEATDPYEVWLNERESERRAASATAAPRTAGRFDRRASHKAPWDAIRVRLSPDGR
jgi:hypothetical protein